MSSFSPGRGRRAAAVVLLLCVLVAVGLSLWARGAATPERDDPHALFIMSERYGVNYYLYRDQLEQLGWSVTVAGLTDTIATCPPYGEQLHVPPLTVDLLVREIGDVASYDCVALMTSTAYFSDDPFRDMMDDPAAMALLTEAHAAGIPVFASCAAVRVLAEADLIAGMSVVGSPKFQSEYEEAGAIFLGSDHPPSNTGNIITAARGMYYSVQNMNAIAEAHEVRVGLVDGRRRAVKFATREIDVTPRPMDESSEPPVWAIGIDSGRSDAARAVCATEDGGCFVAGHTFGAGDGEADLLVARFNADGGCLWVRALGGPGMEYGLGCAAVDGGFVAVGFTTSKGSGGRDVWVTRLNDQGRVVWDASYGGPGDEIGTAVIPTAGGLAVCGHTTSEGEGEEDALLLLLDTDGNELSMRTYGGGRSETATAVLEAVDGGFLIAASTGTFGDGNSNYYLIRTDSNGDELWTRSHGTDGPFGHGFDLCAGMCTSADGCVMVGYSDCQDLMDAHVVSMNGAGEEIWSATFGPTIFYDYACGVCPSRGGFAVCGATKAFDGTDSAYLLELAADGTLLSERTFDAAGSCSASAVCPAGGVIGDLFIVGHVVSSGPDPPDAFVMRVASGSSAGDH